MWTLQGAKFIIEAYFRSGQDSKAANFFVKSCLGFSKSFINTLYSIRTGVPKMTEKFHGALLRKLRRTRKKCLKSRWTKLLKIELKKLRSSFFSSSTMKFNGFKNLVRDFLAFFLSALDPS